MRIAWGTCRLWKPTDLLDPYNSTPLEFQERVGVDATLFELYSLKESLLDLGIAMQLYGGSDNSEY